MRVSRFSIQFHFLHYILFKFMKNIINLPCRGLRVVMGCSLAVALTACGGGGGDGSSPPSSGGDSGGSRGSTESSYLFYTGSLSAVDPANPALPIGVEPGSDLGTVVAAFQSGTYNSATKILTDLHIHALIYTKTDGKFYKVSALKSGSLTPVQVSSESAADDLCVNAMHGTANFTDYAHVDSSPYLYALPGADNNCETGDDVWRMVRLGMSSTDAPVAAKPPVMALGDVATGAISGWLVHDAGVLKKCDANFAACGTAVTVVTNKVNVMLGLGSNRHLLNIDDQLFVYDGNANTLSASLFTIPAKTSVSALAADDGFLYFAHEKTLYKAPSDGRVVASVLATESDNIGFQMAVTAGKVVYTTRAQLSAGVLIKAAQLKVADKTSGALAQLATASTADEAFFFVNGNNIYYSLTDYIASATGLLTIAPIVAGVIDEAGGGKSETVNATWGGGAIFPTSIDLNKSASLAYPPEKMIRIEGYDALGSGKGFAGGTLKIFDAATGTAGVTLGTLPTTEDFSSMNCFGAGDNTLCQAIITITPPPALPTLPFQTDVFFINTATAGSLTRVTATTDKNEAPVY